MANSLMKIIRETVLQIGRNIHFLRLLGKYSLINDCKGKTMIFTTRTSDNLILKGNLGYLHYPIQVNFFLPKTETIHEEFVRKSLEELEKFFKASTEEPPVKQTVTDEFFYECLDEKKYKYPVICTDECKKPTEFDKLENLVDTSDGFLMLAFEDYFVEKAEPPAQKDETLFEKYVDSTELIE